jgi:hypothetical protein
MTPKRETQTLRCAEGPAVTFGTRAMVAKQNIMDVNKLGEVLDPKHKTLLLFAPSMIQHTHPPRLYFRQFGGFNKVSTKLRLQLQLVVPITITSSSSQ